MKLLIVPRSQFGLCNSTHNKNKRTASPLAILTLTLFTTLSVVLYSMYVSRSLEIENVFAVREMVAKDPSALGTSLTKNAAFDRARFNDIYYEPSLPKMWLEKGIVSYGAPEPTYRFLRKLIAGYNVTIAAIGGSVTKGAGLEVEDKVYVELVTDWLNRTFPSASVNYINGAVPATPSSYMSLCLHHHVPENVDLVIVEYNINDGGKPEGHITIRRAHERLLRRILSLPRKPLVMELVVHRWLREDEYPEWSVPYAYHGDDEIGVLAQYYHTPWFSMRSLMWDAVYQNTKKSDFNWTRFSKDQDHPNSLGHRYMADMIITFLREMAADALDSIDSALMMENTTISPLPPPMHKRNWETTNNACYINSTFRERVTETKGFEWINDGGTPERPKWGMVATETGSWLTFSINTNTHSGQNKNANTTLIVIYLYSYEHMGVMEIECISGCLCSKQVVDAHRTEHVSQSGLAMLTVTQAESCVVKCRVLPDTSSGENKIKLVGAITSPQQQIDFNLDGAFLT